MYLRTIQPQFDEALNCYHQKLSWKITEKDWRSSRENLQLKLKTKIPGSSSINQLGSTSGGCVVLKRNVIGFLTRWPKDVDHTKMSLDANFTIKMGNGSAVVIKSDKIWRTVYEYWNTVSAGKFVKLDTEHLYDVDRCITIEAELKVTQVEPKGDVEDSKKITKFMKDIQSIFYDRNNSDVVVTAENEKFYCHKIILRARCDVFKNMLDNPNYIESESNTIDVKEVPAEAVESMLRYIYTGEVPEDPEKLTVDLLNVAEMYLLDHLKEACLESLMKRLNVSSCISTLVMADRFMPSGGNLREMVIEFMKCKVEEVVEMDDWDKLVDKHPALAKELMKAIAKGSKEKHKCQFCVVSFENE